MLQGMLIGLFGNTAFFQLVALTIESIGVAASFTAATALTLLIQGATLSLVNRTSRRSR
ncbi:MAG: hypothetical protein JO358_17555 [Alphaproteobacteria bacterium]|nr:hypothetical protein [Alphaproteobacteria bacterium]